MQGGILAVVLAGMFVLGILGGLLAGAIVEAIVIARYKRQAARSSFPAASQMAIGMTDRRLLVWKRRFLSSRLHGPIGEVPLSRVARISAQPTFGRVRLSFVLVDADPVTLEAYKNDEPERLVQAINQRSPAQVPVMEGAPAIPPPPPPPQPPGGWTSGLPSRGLGGPAAATAVDPAPAPPQPADHRRSCSSCGAENLASASLCWRCQSPFTARPPGAPLAPSSYPPLVAPSVPGSSRERSVGFLVGIAVLVAAVAVGALWGWQFLTRPEEEPESPKLQLPARMAGMDRLYIRRFEREIDRLKEEAARFGYTADAALYGTVGAPSFMVMVIDDVPGDQETEDSIFQAFAEEFASGGELRVDLGSVEVTQQGDVTLRCARVAGGPKMSVCMWVDQRSVGFVVNYLQDLSTTRGFVDVVRNSVYA
jgi:hypothetical protein